MSSIADKITALEADIVAIKAANPNWASNTSLISAIATKDTRIAQLEAQLAQAAAAAAAAAAPAAAAPMEVHFQLDALDPVDNINWLEAEVPPLPIGITFLPFITGDTVDRELDFRVRVWLGETVGNGEESQIARNDGLLKTIMHIAGLTQFDRNLKSDSTYSKRPDMTMNYNNVNIAMVEEKEGDNIMGAVSDLVNKFNWIPQLRRLPFFIGLAFCFSQIRIVLFKRNLPVQVMFAGHITTRLERCAVLKPAINVARVLKHFVDSDMIYFSTLQMGIWNDRPCHKKIRLSLAGVEVQCHDAATYNRLKAFYGTCRDVCFLEKCTSSDDAKFRFNLAPLGLAVLPTTRDQLNKAIVCIATAVLGMHKKFYVHTDIRWANVVLLDNDDWLLIDCYDVCSLNDPVMLGQRAASRNLPGLRWGVKNDWGQVARLLDEIPDHVTTLASRNAIKKALQNKSVNIRAIEAACLAR